MRNHFPGWAKANATSAASAMPLPEENSQRTKFTAIEQGLERKNWHDGKKMLQPLDVWLYEINKKTEERILRVGRLVFGSAFGQGETC